MTKRFILWLIDWLTDWLFDRITEWIQDWMNELMDGWIDGSCLQRWVNEWIMMSGKLINLYQSSLIYQNMSIYESDLILVETTFSHLQINKTWLDIIKCIIYLNLCTCVQCSQKHMSVNHSPNPTIGGVDHSAAQIQQNPTITTARR